MNNNSNFEQAVVTGQTTIVKNLLKQGADPNYIGSNSTMLNEAAFRGYDAIVKSLIEAGADVNKQDQRLFSALHLAASKNLLKTCRLLLDLGASHELKTDTGGTSLHIAAAYGFSNICKLLIEKGASVNAIDNNGCNALQVAIGGTHNSTVKFLIEAGSDLESINVNGHSSVMMAVAGLLETRVAEWSMETQNAQGHQRIYKIFRGKFTFIDNGIEKELPVKDQRLIASREWGPKQHLMYLDKLDIVNLLLKSEPDLHKTDKQGKNLLSLAVSSGEPKLVRYLLDKQLDLNLKTSSGASLLHTAAACGNAEILKMVLDAGAKAHIHSTDNFGWTPLHYLADQGGSSQMAELLFATGADKNAGSTSQRGPFSAGTKAADVAMHFNDHELAALM